MVPQFSALASTTTFVIIIPSFQDVSIMASSLEKFFQSKVKQMPLVEFVLSAEQLIIQTQPGAFASPCSGRTFPGNWP